MYVILWFLILLAIGLTGFGVYAKLGSYRKEIRGLRQKMKAKKELLGNIRERLRNAPLDDTTAELIRRDFQNYEREMY